MNTSDMALATSLSVKGYKITKIDKSNKSKVIFTIEDDPEVDTLVALYWDRELRVDALSFFEELKAIKSRIYE